MAIAQTAAVGFTGLAPVGVCASKLLVCVDSEAAVPAIREWVRSLPEGSSREVILLAVLPRPDTVRTRAIMIKAVREALRETGLKRLAGIAGELADAGIPFRTRVELANGVAATLQCAREQGADLVVMAEPPAPAWQRRWPGASALSWASDGSRVSRLADVPVLILKSREA